MLQQLEEERRQAEETKLYIGDVSLEDILDQETVPIEQRQQETNQVSYELISEEEKLCIGDLETNNQFKMTSNENFPSSDDDSPEDVDTILKEALEDYEAQLSPAGD